MHIVLKLIPLWLTFTVTSQGQNAPASPAEASGFVEKALAAELQAAKDSSHPMRFLLRKSSPRLTTTKDMIETREGSVAMLVSVNDQPPSAADSKKEQQRLDALLADPGKQRHRNQVQNEDMERAQKVLRVLPRAFEYQYVGTIAVGSATAARFVFKPNPNFNPPDLETEVLTAMIGEIWIDPEHGRVIHLQGKVQQDVNFGWGVLGRLYKGGWITIDQADVGGGVWRVVKFQMAMSARILIRTRSFETTEEESHFTPVPLGLDYQKAVEMLRAGHGEVTTVRR